jgi:hypothetical protein
MQTLAPNATAMFNSWARGAEASTPPTQDAFRELFANHLLAKLNAGMTSRGEPTAAGPGRKPPGTPTAVRLQATAVRPTLGGNLTKETPGRNLDRQTGIRPGPRGVQRRLARFRPPGGKNSRNYTKPLINPNPRHLPRVWRPPRIKSLLRPHQTKVGVGILPPPPLQPCVISSGSCSPFRAGP